MAWVERLVCCCSVGLSFSFSSAPSCKLSFRREQKPFCFVYCLLNILIKEIRGCRCHVGTMKPHFSNAFKHVSISLMLQVQNMCLSALLSRGSGRQRFPLWGSAAGCVGTLGCLADVIELAVCEGCFQSQVVFSSWHLS